MNTITTVGAFVVALGFLPLLAQDAADNGVRYFSPDQIKAACAIDPTQRPGGANNGKNGNLGTLKDYSGKFQVSVRRHDEANEPEIHKDHYHVFYVTEGKCQFVTGGKVVGKTLEGGKTWNLDKGSVIVVPTGVVHWFKNVPAGAPWIAFGVEVHSDSGHTATGL